MLKLGKKTKEDPGKKFLEAIIKKEDFNVESSHDGLHVPIAGTRVIDFLPKLFEKLGVIKELYNLQVVGGWNVEGYNRSRVGLGGSGIYDDPENFIKDFHETRGLYPAYIITKGKNPVSGEDIFVSFGDKRVMD